MEKRYITNSVLYENAATYYKIPFIELKNQTIRKDILFIIPEPIATTHQIVSFDATDKQIKIAALDPEDLEIFEFIKKKTGKNGECWYTTTKTGRDFLIQQELL